MSRAKEIHEPHHNTHLAAKIVLCVILAIILLCLILIGILEATPSVTIPTTSLPSPNAFDYYKRAALKVKEANQYLKEQLTPDGKHYAPSEKYRPLFASIAGKDSSGSVISNALLRKERKGRPLFTLPQQEAVLAAYAEAYREFQAGLAYDCRVFSIDQGALSLSDLSLALPRTLRLKSTLHERKGEWAKAMDTRLDLLKFGSDMQKGSLFAYWGITVWDYARNDMEPIISHLTEPEASASILRLQQIADKDMPYAQKVLDGKKEIQAFLLEFFLKHSYAWHAHIDEFTEIPFSKREAWTLSRRRFVSLYLDTFEAEERRVKQPYRAYLADKSPLRNPIAVEYQSMFEEAYFEYVYDRTTCLEMLKLRLAVRAYFAKRNSYPATLQDLVSAGYLKSIPTDTFANDGKFRYKKEKQDYRLYSVGPDGVDDGGTPVQIIKGNYSVDAQSTGDIVVGYNLK